jgi:hypothetical protein
MDELVKNTVIVDSQLVKAVTALMPGESIECILDETRLVILKRVFNSLKYRHFTTVVHLVDEIKTSGLTEEDAKKVMMWFVLDEQVGFEFKKEINSLLESELLGSIFKFVSKIEPNIPDGCCIPLKLKCLKLWSRNT